MVKETVAACIDDSQIVEIETYVSSGRFRNKSHFIDEAIKSFLIDLKNEGESNGQARVPR